MSELAQLRQHLKARHHRQLVVLSGSKSWQQSQIQNLFSAAETVFWITAKSADDHNAELLPLDYKFSGFEAIESRRLGYHLGQEIDGAIFDVHEGISADSLGIVSGMIRAGGLMIVLTPEKDEWKTLNNPEDSRFLNTPITLHQAHKHFTQHLIQCWQSEDVIWLTEKESDIKLDTATSNTNKIELATADQLDAIQKVQSVAFGHRKRPLVISADRGRGKTAALGLAAIESLIQGKQHIAITASRPDQVKTAFTMAAQALSKMAFDKDIEVLTSKHTLLEFEFQDELKTFEYIAPDQLILTPTSADILMVDEAAHLPTPLLIELLKRHHRMVFSTTLHGYEGSGRGFELRFKKHLNQYTPDWKHCELKTPVRWAENDPLERVIFDTLLLKAKIAQLDAQLIEEFDSSQVAYEVVDSQTLLEQPERMQALFGLLVQAHYQTSPNDLQQLLNAPNLQIITAEYSVEEGRNLTIGAVLCIQEGKINPAKNRAHGHLVPQLLTRHYAQDDFLMLSTLRVMRIAVHPSLQRKSIGLNLIQQVEKLGLQNRVDYISSSFGGSDELLPFWFKLHFWPLHVGVKRDKASGSHNVVVAKPVSAMSRQALSLIQTRFQEQFPHILLESLPHLPAIQLLQIIETFRFKKTNYGLEKALINYQTGERPYESISSKLWEWSLQSAGKIKQASPVDQAIWCDKVIKKHNWQTVAHKYHLAGRKGVENELRSMIECCIGSKAGKEEQQRRLSQPYI